MSSEQEKAASPEEKVRVIRTADLFVSSLMIIGGLWFAYDSFLMSYETIKAGHATIPTSPGLFPFIVSILIVVTSAYVLRNALRSGANVSFLNIGTIRAWASNFENWTPLIVMSYFLVYVFVLIGNIPFIFATIAFGVVTMVTFRAIKLIWIIVINVLYASFVIYCFTNFAYTKFPMSFF